MNQTKWKTRYPTERAKYDFSRLQSYERRKADWIATHPEATPQEYQAAMNRICKECGA